MSTEVFQAVQALTKTPQSFTQICLIPFGEHARARRILPAEMNASGEALLDIIRTRSPSAPFIGYVVLHASLRINLKLDGLNRWSQSWIILPGILIIGIVLRIVDMLLRPVHSQSFFCHFKLRCSISEAQERQDPDEDPDGTGLNALEASHIDGLTIISQPVAKVHSFHHHRGPFVALNERNGLEEILNISMPPVVTFDLGDGCWLFVSGEISNISERRYIPMFPAPKPCTGMTRRASRMKKVIRKDNSHPRAILRSGPSITLL